jgi:hypothetical protein
VEVGRTVDHLRIVTDGLYAGDNVIVNGLQRVRPGMPVAPSEVATQLDTPALDRVAAHGAPGRAEATSDAAASSAEAGASSDSAAWLTAPTSSDASPPEQAIALSSNW